MAGKSGKASPMTMKKFEGSKADKAADKAAVAKINKKKGK